MISEFIWQLIAAVAIATFWDLVKRWLNRDVAAVRELKAELKATHADWEKRFSFYERAHDQLVARFNSSNPSPNPLGKHYTTRARGAG